MKEPVRKEAYQKPDTVEYLGDNRYAYNFDIQEIEKTFSTNMPENTQEQSDKAYSYIQVILYGIPTYAFIVKALIRAYLTQSEEFDIINSYNKAVILNETNSKDITQYKEYLQLLEKIKNTVKADDNVKN